MVSSVAKKDLTHDWENERYKDYQESMRNFQSSSKSETKIPKSDKKTSKQEIFLPKTRLSRTGQLLLFTNDDETDLYQAKISSILAKKSYSKKWIEDVGQELNLEAAKFLDERLNENLDTFLNNRKSIGKIIGKNSNFLVQDLNGKSGKDRRLQKTPYLEYLPTNFDTKSELANALKSLNSSENLERTSSSHQNRISGLSFAEIVESNSSDDEKNAPILSRLSSQPILSTQALINKLSSSARIDNKLPAKTLENSGENDEKSADLVANIQESEIAISYKETFEPEFSTSGKQSSRKVKSSARDDKSDRANKKANEFQNSILNSKKILEKRYVIRTQNNSPNIINKKTTDNSETISLSNTKSTKSNSQRNSATINRPTTYSAARKKIISPKLTDSDNTRHNFDSLAISGANKYDADDFANLPGKIQSSFYSSFVNNRAPNTPLPSHDKPFTSASITKPFVHFKPATDDENLEPITISVTEIENELTGNSIKIRRFFDRQSIRINKMNIKQDPKQTFSNQVSKSFSAQSSRKRENKQFIEEKMEPEIENFSIKLIPKINRTKSAPMKNTSQTNFLMPSLELGVDSNQSDFKQKNAEPSEIFNDLAEKSQNSELNQNAEDTTAIQPKQDSDDEKIITQNADIDLSPNKEENNSDKNYLSADYVDNLSISSRVSSVRKNSSDWVYYENNSEKTENESEAYEKLSKPDKITDDKNLEEASSSDYQQIMSSRLNSDQEISYKEYTSYDDTDLSAKIETILEENSAQILANNFENQAKNEIILSPKYNDLDEDSGKIVVDKIAENKDSQNIDEIVVNDSKEDIHPNQAELIEEIDKIDAKEEAVSDKVDSRNEFNFIDNENGRVDSKEEFNSSQVEVPREETASNNVDGKEEINKSGQIEADKIEPVEKRDLNEGTLSAEALMGQQVEKANLENIKFEPIKDLTNNSENTMSGPFEEGEKNEEITNTGNRKISISIVIKQPELTEESSSTFGTNLPLEKTESDQNLSKKVEKKNSITNDQDNEIRKEKELDLAKMFKENVEKQRQILQESNQVPPKRQNDQKNLSENDNKSSVSEKQTKKVEFSDHVQEQIIAPSTNDTLEFSKTEKLNLTECKKSTDFGTKNNFSENKNFSNKPTSDALHKLIGIEDTQNVLKPKEDESKSAEKSSKYKINLSKIDDLLGIKSEEKSSAQEINNEPKKIQKPVKESKFERKMREKRDRYKNFPYLQLPWDSYETVVDQEAFKEAFSIPDVLNPLIHQIDPENISVDELVLERRILEDKILELRQEKLNILTMTDEDRAKMAKKNDKKKGNKKSVDLKVKQDIDLKERVIREERIRLQNEAFKIKLERDNVGKLMDEALSEKEKEIENLNNELVSNQKELNSQLNSIMEQISYLEGTEDQIREVLAQARVELRNRIKQNQQEARKNLREMHEERKESKLFDFNVKKKELEWLLGMYTDSPEELEKIKAKQETLESEIEQWLFKFENDCIDQEKEIEDREVEEDNMLITMEHDEEENSLKSIKQEQFELLQEKKSLIENFEEIKTKIIQRIEIVKQEKEIMEDEKKKFEINILMDIERQKQKLLEILEAEKDAKDEIKMEVEKYKQTLFLRREKNLSLKSDLSFLTHSHNITKPYVFSYVTHWPIELFAKPFDQDKIKKSKPKK
ncbi:golgin subfamily A member 6 22 isoform X3 [Brachionus plicatilis]|uniref:Golgin subfamily A member 6 22 isoform X3 n=1 Tax=Brachionus plicatilis TaxID=10195 RepID=A0A3M7SZ09_BRAPC|nr:golgin subfamily A member 6 22 isoform X3 [Brachionus plicatilis]